MNCEYVVQATYLLLSHPLEQSIASRFRFVNCIILYIFFSQATWENIETALCWSIQFRLELPLERKYRLPPQKFWLIFVLLSSTSPNIVKIFLTHHFVLVYFLRWLANLSERIQICRFIIPECDYLLSQCIILFLCTFYIW